MIDTDRIRQAVDVQRLYAELFPGLARRDGKTARCFREDAHAHKDRSASVQLHRDGFHCHGCATRLDAIGLIMASQRCDFRQAVAWLSNRYRLDVEPAARGVAPWTWPTFSPPQIAFLYRLHEITEPLKPTPSATRWLSSRKVGVDTAWALGCRDWSPAAAHIQALIDQHKDVATSLRLHHDGKPWWPMRGPRFIPGVVVPAFVPGLAVPCAWRWRFAEPVDVGGRLLKTAAQPAAQPIPLGIHVPDRTGTVVGAAQCRILFIAEGEPDWLSFHDVAAGCVGVLGLCDVSGGWRSAWSELLRDPAIVVVVTHTKKDDPIGKAVGSALVDLHGRKEAAKRFLRIAYAEGRDANNIHCEGRLLAQVASTIRGITDA